MCFYSGKWRVEKAYFSITSFAKHYECMKCSPVIGEWLNEQRDGNFLYPYRVGSMLVDWAVITRAVTLLGGKEEA
jgi:hypothetical protein